MKDVYGEVKGHPNYCDLTRMIRMQLSSYDMIGEKHTNHDNKFLKKVWLFLYHGI